MSKPTPQDLAQRPQELAEPPVTAEPLVRDRLLDELEQQLLSEARDRRDDDGVQMFGDG